MRSALLPLFRCGFVLGVIMMPLKNALALRPVAFHRCRTSASGGGSLLLPVLPRKWRVASTLFYQPTSAILANRRPSIFRCFSTISSASAQEESVAAITINLPQQEQKVPRKFVSYPFEVRVGNVFLLERFLDCFPY